MAKKNNVNIVATDKSPMNKSTAQEKAIRDAGQFPEEFYDSDMFVQKQIISNLQKRTTKLGGTGELELNGVKIPSNFSSLKNSEQNSILKEIHDVGQKIKAIEAAQKAAAKEKETAQKAAAQKIKQEAKTEKAKQEAAQKKELEAQQIKEKEKALSVAKEALTKLTSHATIAQTKIIENVQNKAHDLGRSGEFEMYGVKIPDNFASLNEQKQEKILNTVKQKETEHIKAQKMAQEQTQKASTQKENSVPTTAQTTELNKVAYADAVQLSELPRGFNAVEPGMAYRGTVIGDIKGWCAIEEDSANGNIVALPMSLVKDNPEFARGQDVEFTVSLNENNELVLGKGEEKTMEQNSEYSLQSIMQAYLQGNFEEALNSVQNDEYDIGGSR